MSKIVFVPLTDEMLYDSPELITGPITTYQPIISNNSHRSDSAKKSLQFPSAYLKGNLVNGLDVVYVGDKPTRRIKA